MRKLAVLVALVGSLFAASAAQAAPPTSIFDGAVDCGQVTAGKSVAGSEDQTWCGTIRPWPTGPGNGGPINDKGDGYTTTAGPNEIPTVDPVLSEIRATVPSFDGVPIDVNVAFPDETEHGSAPYPLVYMFHGYGGQRMTFGAMQRWLNRGYAVLSQTNRGFHQSCGASSAKDAAAPICADEGYVRLNDSRYEVRDAQLFAGMLVDEGLVQPTKIAATGGSYGGGMSMALAALKDRVMLPGDGGYTPWTSPEGTPMSLAVATPNIPWTDLAYSLVPNGSNIDYLKDASYEGRFGVMKQSYVNGLYFSGLGAPGYYTAAGVQPEADLAGWKAFMDAGEPYDGKPAAKQMLDEVTTYHSSYYIDHQQPPAPLLISSGFTDDLFPANEATRYYNRTRAQFPNSPIGLFFGSFGHMRGQNGSEVSSALRTLENKWVDHYLVGDGAQPASDVTTYTEVCPDGDPDGGPYVTSNWVSQSPGEITLKSAAKQTVNPDGGDRAVGAKFNPAPSGVACPDPPAPGAPEPGIANYETAAAPAGGYTLMGSPTVIAKVTQAGENSQLTARVVDVTPDGATKTLVNRGVWRPANSGYQVFQLNPNGWHVAEGHKLRLEILPFDGGNIDPVAGVLANFTRPSNGQQPATIENLELRIPVREAPGSLNGLVKAPAKRVMPDRAGAELAPGNEAIGSQTLEQYRVENYGVVGNPSRVGAITVKGKQLTVKLTCKIGNDSCRKATLIVKGAPKKGKKGNKLLVVKKGGLTVAKPGQTKTFRIPLTGKARKFFRDKTVRKRGKKRVVRGPNSLRSKVIVNEKFLGFTNVKRVGKVR